MTWFKVDDKFYSHRKVRTLSKGAIALWVRAGSYCADHLTDGLVHRSDVGWLEGTSDEVQELIACGLWHAHPEGYVFHDWDEYQPSKESVERQREGWRARKQREREKKVDTSSYPVPSLGSRESRRDITHPADPEMVADVVSDIRSRLRGKAK